MDSKIDKLQTGLVHLQELIEKRKKEDEEKQKKFQIKEQVARKVRNEGDKIEVETEKSKKFFEKSEMLNKTAIEEEEISAIIQLYLEENKIDYGDEVLFEKLKPGEKNTYIVEFCTMKGSKYFQGIAIMKKEKGMWEVLKLESFE